MGRVMGLLFVAVCLGPGCGRQGEWEITVENRGVVPAYILVTTGAVGMYRGRVYDSPEGKTIKVSAGRGETVVRTVKVVLGKNEQLHKLNDKLRGGKRYAIIITAEGKVETSIWDK